MASQPPLQISTEIISSDSQPQFPPTVIKTLNEHFLLTPKVIEALTDAIRNSSSKNSSFDFSVNSVEIEKKAGEAYKSNEFDLAIDLYSQAINENGVRRAGLFADRALANIKISKFIEAIDDAEMAIRLDPSLAKAYLHKGIACLKKKEFQAAKTTLEAGAALPPHDVRFSKLIRECEIHIPRSTAESIAGMEGFPNYDHTSNTLASTEFYDKEDDCIQSDCFNESLIDSCVIVNEDGDEFHQQDLHKDNQTLSQDWTPTFTTDMKFDKRQGLVDWVRKLGAKNGMVLVIYRSSNDIKRAPRIWMACEHNGYNKPRGKKAATVENGNTELVEASKKKRKRKTSTKKQGCPFRIKGICVKGTWTMEVMNGTHNHPLASSLEGRAYAGRLNPEEEKIFADLMRDGVKVKEALTILKQRDPENVTTLQTLYNLKKKLKAQEKGSEGIDANSCVHAVGL